MTSEERHGISAQPSDTCPMIDEVIEKADAIEKAIRGYDRMDEVGLRDACHDVGWEVSDISSLAEGARKNTTLIRAWGQEWKELALWLIKQQEEEK